jgi:hypothetical protein
MKAENPNKTGKFSNGGERKYVPMWMKRTVTVTPKESPPVETVKKSYSFSFNLGWLWELALMAAIIYLFCQSCSVTVVAH